MLPAMKNYVPRKINVPGSKCCSLEKHDLPRGGGGIRIDGASTKR